MQDPLNPDIVLFPMNDLELRRDDSLHYASVVTLVERDVIQIRKLLMKTIEAAKATIKESKDKSLHSFCLDFFEV